MTKEEIIKILNLINSVNEEERTILIAKYQEKVAKYFNALRYPERKELIAVYNGILFDMGLIKSAFLSDEERERRRNAAMNKPKFTETEEKIREIFVKIFWTEPFWLKTRKSKNMIPGLFKSGPAWDANIYDCLNFTEDYKLSGSFISLPKKLPAIYIDILDEHLFLYMQKAEETDLESVELNQKAVEFLIEIQKTFATRTPDAIYLSSGCGCNGNVIWMETYSSFKCLLDKTSRESSGWSNIVSLSEEALNTLKNDATDYEFNLYKKDIERRFNENGNHTTIAMLNELRDLFDTTFAKNKQTKRELVSPKNSEN